MLDADTFLTTVYVLVDDLCQQAAAAAPPPVPRHGPAAALSESEVITLALFAQWSPFPSERAFYRYAERHLRPLFPRLPARSQFNRQGGRHLGSIVAVGLAVARQLEQLVCAQQRAGEPCPYEVLDGMGVATRNLKRRGGGWLGQIATIGRSNRLGWYEGVYLLTAVTPEEVLTGFGVASASTKDQPVADTFLAVRHLPQLRDRLPEVGTPVAADGIYLADTGFEGRAWHAKWDHVDGATVICRPKARDTRHGAALHAWAAAERRAFAGLREIVETVHARLLDSFGLDRLRPHSLRGLRAHLAAKLAAFNVAGWLNLRAGRPLMAFADLLDW